MQRLAALVPHPRLHPIRFRWHGVRAPKAKLRALVVPPEPEAPKQAAQPAQCDEHCAHHRPARLSGAKLLRCMFEINMDHSANCGGKASMGSQDNRRIRRLRNGRC